MITDVPRHHVHVHLGRALKRQCKSKGTPEVLVADTFHDAAFYVFNNTRVVLCG